MEYRDRDILLAIGLECQLCIGLKKTTHLHVSCPRLHSDTKNRGCIGGPFKEIKVSDRVSDTCIVLLFWLAKNISLQFSIKILTYLIIFPNTITEKLHGQ